MNELVAEPWLIKTHEVVLGYGEYVIGRDPRCDIHVNDPCSSRIHARLTFDASGVRITDLGSLSGTFLGRRRIAEPVEMQAGTLKIGGCKIIVVVEDQPSAESDDPVRLRVVVLHAASYAAASPSLEDTQEILVQPSANTSGHGASQEMGDDSPEMLHVGMSVEFLDKNAARRVLHLKSITGRGRVYCFGEDHHGHITFSVTAMRLSQRLREHSARVL